MLEFWPSVSCCSILWVLQDVTALILKTKFIFFFSSPFYSRASNLGKFHANCSGKILTSSSVLDQRVKAGELR